VDYTLIALIAMIGLALVWSHRHHSRTWPGRPGYRYQRVLSVGVVGLLLAVTGAIGWDVSHAHELFGGMKWVDGPIWWQLGLGVGMVAVSVFMGRRVPANATRSPMVR